jgi:hypothetical protein
MANTVYQTFKTALLNGAVNLSTANVYVALVSSAYTPNFTTDQFLSTVAANIVARSSAALSGVTITNGVVNANSVTFSSVTGSTVTQFVLYVNSGSDSTSQLILCDNTASQGLPVTPNGGSITLNFDSGANKIFAL